MAKTKKESLESYVNKVFSEKVYPNPDDPMVKAQMEEGIWILQRTYLGRIFPWVLNGVSFVPGPLNVVDMARVVLPSETLVHPNSKLAEPFFVTRDPNKQECIVGQFPHYDPEVMDLEAHLPKIREAGRRFFNTVPWEKRVQLLRTIHEVAMERFWLLCAAKAYECGQQPREQIGETDETVDFPLANAWYLQRINQEKLLPTPAFAGDISGKRYVSNGTYLNVEPYNFPDAISMDMLTKALAMGNSVVCKPSPKSALSGYLMWETVKIAFERMGIDWHGVINFAPGGANVVDAILSSTHVAGMSFTGSSGVLADIRAKHGDMLRRGWAGQAPLAFGSAETSGVNMFVVAKDADPAYASGEFVKGLVGRQGQKCSSPRLVFVHRSLEDVFLKDVERRLDALVYGDVKHGADIGAVATKADRIRLCKQMLEVVQQGIATIAYQCRVSMEGACDFPPTLFRVSKPATRDLQKITTLMNTEFFGPVSIMVPFDDIAEVEHLAEYAKFALTAGLITDDIEVFAQVLNFIPAGNVYWNRKCTGALVETECFGGLRSLSSLSGVKGRDALPLFGSMQIISGFYPKDATEKKRAAIRAMLRSKGFVLSKS